MKKIIWLLMMWVCCAGVAFAQKAPDAGNGDRQNAQGESAQSAGETARQKYALDIKKVGISKAVKNALKEGVLPIKDLITVAVAQGVKPVNVLAAMSINGVNSNDIIAARVEGVTAEVVATAYAAVEQFKADVAKGDNVDAAVKNAVEGGILSLDSIMDFSVTQLGVNPANVLSSMSKSGVSLDDAIKAAELIGVPSDSVADIYALEGDEPPPALAYTPPPDEDTKGQQRPGTPGDNGQPGKPGDTPSQPYTPPFAGNAPPFGPPNGTPTGGPNGPPEDFTPASPSRPI